MRGIYPFFIIVFISFIIQIPLIPSPALEGTPEYIPLPSGSSIPFQIPSFSVSNLTGKVGLLFYDNIHSLWYAERDPTTTTWSLEQCFGGEGFPSSTAKTSLVFDDMDTPLYLLRFYDEDAQKHYVGFIRKEHWGTSYVYQLDFAMDDHDLDVTLTIDSENNLYAIWGKEDHLIYGIKRANETEWSKYDLEVPDIGSHPQLVFYKDLTNESASRAHLVYISDNNQLYYFKLRIDESGLRKDGGLIQGSDGENASVRSSSTAHICLDQDGYPLIVA
ncbi:MAG: hypothetical protein ACW991_01590, partial [Candidatus Hodarchaeales archaeon]